MAAKLRATKDALRDGLTTRAAAKHLGCHPQTISWRLARLDTTAYDTRRDQVYSGREMAAMFGYAPDSAGSYRWLRRLADAGLGPAPRRGRHWRVTAEALMAFLESPASHGLIKIKRISDPDWRAYAEQARAGAFVVPRRKAAQA
jgi:transposase